MRKGKEDCQRRRYPEKESGDRQSGSDSQITHPSRERFGSSQDGMDANGQMMSGRGKIDSPAAGFGNDVSPGEPNKALCILCSSRGAPSYNRKIARQFPLELHLSDGIPYCGMKEEQPSGRERKFIPDSIPTANVVQFMTQNVFQFRAIFFNTGTW